MSGDRGGQEGGISKGNGGKLWGVSGNVHPDCGDGFMGVCVYRSAFIKLCTLNVCCLSCVLYFNKDVFFKEKKTGVCIEELKTIFFSLYCPYCLNKKTVIT